jgi:hypothetical protein
MEPTMKTLYRLLIALTFSFSQGLLAGGNTHKYWVCGVTTYHAVVDGNPLQGQCRANTAYSEPPCREFVVEFNGANGVRPGAPYAQSEGATTTRIEINKTNGLHIYTHTINKSGNKWVYNGKCSYFEAPANEKIHMDKGLETLP